MTATWTRKRRPSSSRSSAQAGTGRCACAPAGRASSPGRAKRARTRSRSRSGSVRAAAALHHWTDPQIRWLGERPARGRRGRADPAVRRPSRCVHLRPGSLARTSKSSGDSTRNDQSLLVQAAASVAGNSCSRPPPTSWHPGLRQQVTRPSRSLRVAGKDPREAREAGARPVWSCCRELPTLMRSTIHLKRDQSEHDEALVRSQGLGKYVGVIPGLRDDTLRARPVRALNLVLWGFLAVVTHHVPDWAYVGASCSHLNITAPPSPLSAVASS